MTAVGLLDVATRVARSGEPHHQRNVPATGSNVSGRLVDVTVVAIGDGTVAMTFVDVTDERAAETRLKEIAARDHLTGLWNRNRFRSELNANIASGVPMVVALLDLNDFKLINDTMGHSTGDLLLQVLGDRLTSNLPSHWTMARLGGDEFAVAAPSDAEEAEEVAKRIAEVLTPPLELEGIRITPEISIGIASHPLDGRDETTLLRMAEAALQSAKEHGDTYRTCTERDRVDAERRDRLSRSLAKGLDQEQFMLYAQPFVNLSTYQIVGAEGLARWVLPGTGVLTPNLFLDLLGMSGNLTDLTDHMITHAAALTEGGRTISINLSPADLHRTDLVELVSKTIGARQNPDAGRLWLEILESRVFAAGHDMIDALIASGVDVAIDDFGAAFSSLTRLADHEISVLKLDRALLQSLGSNHRARTVIRSVVDASHDLGAVVVAEGVETMEACSVVEDLGCDLVQGYLLGRPAPEPLVADLLQRPGSLTPDEWPDIDAIRAWEADAVG